MENKMILVFFILFFITMGALTYFQFKLKKAVNHWEFGKAFDVRGIDLSHYNGHINYHEFHSLDFVFLKVTEGETWTDKAFLKYYSAFREKEIAVGTYHFFRFDKDGKSQVNHFQSNLWCTGGL